MLEVTSSRIWRIAHNQKYWSLFFVFIAINFVIYRSFSEPGLILAGDFTRAEVFSRFIGSNMYPLWNEDGQSSNLQSLHQLGLYVPAVIISSVIDIPSTIVYLAYFLLLGSISGVFSFKLAEYIMSRNNLKPRFEFALAASLSFVFSTFVVESTFHPAIAFSFYLSPVLLYAVIKGIEENRLSYLLFSSLIYSLTAVTLHFVVFGLIVILSYIVFDLLYKILIQRFNSLSVIKRAAWYILVIVGPFIAMSSYWLIPNFAYAGHSIYSLMLTANDPQILYRNVDLINVFSVKGFFNLHEAYPFTQSEFAYINILSIMLTIIATSSLLLLKQNKLTIYLGIFLVLSVIISLIPVYLPSLYNWFVFDAPGSSLYSWVFRAPKFYLFMSIPIAIMIGLSGLRLYHNRYTWRKWLLKSFPPSFIGLVLVLSLVPNYVLLTGDFNGHHKSHTLPEEYTSLFTYLQKQDENYKSILGPPYAGLNSTWTNNKIGDLIEEQISATDTFNSMQTLDQYIYPVIFGIRFPYGSLLAEEGTNNVQEFMGPINVKYIILHDDINNLKIEIDNLSKALDKQEGLESRDFGFITLYTVKETSPQFSSKNDTILIQGGLLRFDSIFRTESIDSNATGALFSDMTMDQSSAMWQSFDTLIPENELAYAEFILDKSDVIVIPPSDYTDTFAPLKEWSKSSTNIQSFLNQLQRNGVELPYQYDYGEDIVFTSARDSQLDMSVPVPRAEEYKVLARYFANDRGGMIDLNFNEKSLPVATKSQLNRFVWADLGTLRLSEGTQTLSIENRDGLNAINLITLVPVDKYEEYKVEFMRSMTDKNVVHILEPESDFIFDAASSRVVRDIEYSNGKALELNSEDIASSRFEILKDGNYDLTLYGEGNVTIDIDGKIRRGLSFVDGVSHIEALSFGPGYHDIEITPSDGTNFSRLDSMHVGSRINDDINSLFAPAEPSAEEPLIQYNKIDPTSYQLTVKAESPFMLAFADAYDERWRAEVITSDGIRKLYKPLPLYGAINGFMIDTVGDYVISIKYAPQEIFYLGAAISTVAYALIVVYIIRAHHPLLLRYRHR